jgi:hypothetical protein
VEPLRRLAPAVYCIAALLLLLPMMDYVGNAWPFRPGAVDWRYGVVGMISTYLLSPLLGLLTASVTAALLEQHRISRLIGVLVWIGAIVLLMALGGFLLDSLQVRSAAPANTRWVTTTSFLIASTKILAAAVTLMILGVGNLRASRETAKVTSSRKTHVASRIIGQG